MDGVDGRYQDSRTSSPEESLGGSYIKVVLRNGRQCACQIHEGNTEVLERCKNCGFYLTKWVRLVCKDILCEGCFRESRVYMCPVHLTRTQAYQAKSGSFQYNPKCKSISIKCPACGSTPDLSSIEEHIEKCHPGFGARSTELQNPEQDKTESSSSRESLKCNAQSSGDCDSALSNVGQSRLPRQVSGTEMVKTGPWNMKAFGDHSHHSPKSRDPEYGNPEKLKSSECIASAEKEHVETCYNGIVACRKCKVRVHFSDFEQHTQLCKVEDSKKSTPTSEVKQEDDRREEKELDNNIQELKDKIKVLEKRLEDIEKPLLKILERLRRGS